jgi:hypothetical protein
MYFKEVIMLNKFKRMILFSAFTLLIISPSTSFAWRSCVSYGSGYWDYHGSGRDHPYSQYINRNYSSDPPDYLTFTPDYDVPPPVQQIIQIPAEGPPNEFTVNIPNKHGGYTAVVIKRSGIGFIGPQGEYYPEFPKVFQLEIIYGS